MSGRYFKKELGSLENGTSSPVSPSYGVSPGRNSALSTKLTSVLSRSYADPEIRNALSILDTRGVANNVNSRRNLRIDAQEAVIQCDGEIVQDFGVVAEVLDLRCRQSGSADNYAAVEADWYNDCGSE